MSEDTVKEAFVHPRHVTEAAVRHKAASVLLAHNHPARTVRPSSYDQAITRRLVEALGGIDIKVVDHVIVAGDQFYSFAKEGLMPALEAARP